MPPPLKVGVNIVPVQPDYLVRYAQLAEDLGFEAVWYGEHVALPQSNDWWKTYPGVIAAGAEGGPRHVPFKPRTKFLDPMVVLAALATATRRIRLGVGVYLLALRDAVLAGRTIASVDVMSGGRLDMAVGLGWTPDEYRYTGNVWETRGRKMDEMIAALRVLFAEEAPEFHGRFFDFPPLGFEPKPVQTPRLPILVGGGPGPAEVRAARLGDGWHGPAASIPRIRQLLAEYGREREPFRFSTISLSGDAPLAELEGLAEQGVDQAVVTVWNRAQRGAGDRGADAMRALEDYAKAIGLG
jgi:probable F420-dependent oxidoreductase